MSIDEYIANYQYKYGVSDDFHIYAVEWNSQRITFSVDGINHLNYEPLIKNQYTWPFDAEQYLLLNVAIEPSISSNFIQSAMEVDYVRVYQQSPLATSNVIKTNDIIIFPNPATEKINLIIPESQIGNEIVIYSILGQKLDSFILHQEQTILDVSAYINGIYFVKIETSSEINMYKFIKK